jgi:GNAT superfamily N-acetyltransferase
VTDPEITRGGPGDLTSLEPLWVSVHQRHAESMPELAPYVDDATTWAERRVLYDELLAKPGTVLLLARVDGALVGYGLAHVMRATDTWIADTWVTGERVGEIESLSVLPEHRGKGLGGRLMEGLEAALREQGVHDLIIGLLPGNEHAARLYARRGYTPTWLYLSRFEGR